MANFNQQPNKSASGTSIQHVKQQNAQAGQAAGQGQFGTEFASETNAAEVRQQNAQSQANKAKASGSYGQNQQS